MDEVEKKLRSLLNGEHTSIEIQFNQHKVYYRTIAEAIEDGSYDYAYWISEEEKYNAIAADSVWELTWYPDTPVGSHSILGASLKAVVNAALEEKE